ncbi:beta-N-acetylhexosaminidase [Paenibacillus sp. FSL H7-0942]|uniref:beta-N-acetylhexosaminidase n=1 Tax=Paenibacillus TaxID=44249 RepID=UPI0003E26C49|nr:MULTISPECIES: beta-N-acetylhexosaminidase [Paenibacillus]ETT29533.1 glycoside hydrolase family protein [Paenibacillus sp. FSL R5-192]OME98456.1 glycoside hydrolase [Paenibacillus amylolyticus]OMF06256.1 glycoside hydrolase [Paenibacillus amylolyticus]
MKPLNDLTLEQKVGQLLMCGFHSQHADEQITRLIRDYHVGGVIYFRRNVESVDQLTRLSAELQEMAAEAGALPLMISVDQEGGMVARIDQEGMTQVPGNMALGATGNAEYTLECAQILGRELKNIGIDMNLAPVVDVNNNPLNPVIGVRSYGEHAESVAAHGVAAITGYQSQGIAATAKHFPGHGDTAVDSHLGMVTVPHDRNRLEQMELLPFRKAIEAGVDAIMTAHVMFPSIEPEPIPATLSHKVLTGLLREEMGFEGIIITDCLEMHAISKPYGVAEAAIRAVEAGADLILVSHTLQDQVAALEAIVEAVRTGRISEEVIHQAVERIMTWKKKRCGQQNDHLVSPKASETVEATDVEPVDCTKPTEPNELTLFKIASSSITIVHNDGLLPLDPEKGVYVIWPEVVQRTEVDEPWSHTESLGMALSQLRGRVREHKITTQPTYDETDRILADVSDSEQVIVCTYTSAGHLPKGQQFLVEKLSENHSLIVIALRNPYDLLEISRPGSYVCTYENTPAVVRVLSHVLTGGLQPTGSLPVRLR